MKKNLRLAVLLAGVWAGQNMLACPLPTVGWSPNPVCVGCGSDLALGYTDMPGYSVVGSPWVESITNRPTADTPTAEGVIDTNTASIQWTDPGYCEVVVTSKLNWVCVTGEPPVYGRSTNVNITSFIVARMETLTLAEAGNTNNSLQDTTNDDATPEANTLIICEAADGTAEIEIDLSCTPTNATANEVGGVFAWGIEGSGWTPAEGDFSGGAVVAAWSNAGGAVDREFTLVSQCNCGAGGNCGDCPYRRMLKIAVLKVDIVQTQLVWAGGSLTNAPFNLTLDSSTNVTWEITPDLGTNGARFAAGPTGTGTNTSWQGSNAWIAVGLVQTAYTVRAYANLRTNCFDTAHLVVITNYTIIPSSRFICLSNTVTAEAWTVDGSGVAVPTNSDWTIPEGAERAAFMDGAVHTNAMTNASEVTIIGTNISAALDDVRVHAHVTGNAGINDDEWFTVLKVDLDVDSDNDGTIDSDDTGEDEFEQYEPGVIVCVDRHGDATNLDHLVEMKLSLLPANILCGELTLEALVNGSCVKIWTNSAKAVEVTLPKTWTLGADTIPSSLWIDGISAGQVVLDLYYKDTSGTEIGRDKVAVYVTKTVSRSPSGTFAYGWEPCGWFGTGTGGQGSNTPETVLNNVVSQGWNIVTARYRDGSYLNDAVESCTLANFKGMSLGGLIEVSTHGNAALIAACYTLTYAAASNWMAGESNMFVAVAEECAGMHGVYALIPWFESNWKPGLDTGDAISMFMSCHGATNGANSLVNRAGGRVKYGYVPSPAHTNMRSNNNMLFGRMNGSVDGGSRRCAGEAYEGGTDYADDLRMFGNDWTTLCPAPLAVFPASSPGSRKGWGCIIFDTYMDDSYAAAQAVTKLSGSCGVSNFRWVDNGSGKYCLGFNFDNTGGGGATMRAHADKCKNDCDGDLGRKLDGNRIQENEDDRDWTF